MANAKKELLGFLEGKANIKCATLSDYDKVYSDLYPEDYDEEFDGARKDIVLKVDFSESEYNKFLDQLYFDYQSGFGRQNLFGTIWLADGTWCTRGEYDGSEWWIHNTMPAIPKELLS
jgi:hypothetical protein